MNSRRLLALVATIIVAPPLMAQTPPPPVAAQKPHVVTSPHGDRQDPYYWLRDDTRKSPEMLEHLKAENAYTEAVLAPVKGLREQLFEELKGRIKPDDEQPAWRMRGYLYSSRFLAGKDYAVNVRRPAAGGDEQVLVDQNALAAGHSYFSLGQWDVSLDNTRLAYSTDTVGRRQYVIEFKDIATGKLYPEKLTGTSGNVAWAADNKTVFYVEIDPKTLLTKRVKRHVVGTDPATDVLVYEEPDESFYMGVSRTKDDAFLCIGLSSTVSSETRCIPASSPTDAFKVLVARERDFEYDADHVAGRWVIRTNWQAKNFRVVQATDATVGDRAQWQDVVPHRADVFVSAVEPFDRYLVVGERREGLQRLRILDAAGQSRDVDSDEPAYVMGIDVNREAGTTTLRYSYTSLTTPSTIYDLDMVSGARTLVKETPVLGGFDKTKYATERIWVTARDGARVPVSIVYRSRHEARRHRAAVPVRVRFIRHLDRPRLQQRLGEPARPRFRDGDRAHPRWTGDGACLVRGRQAAQEDEHVHGLRGCDQGARRPEVRCRRQGLRHGRQCRWVADGRGREPGAGARIAAWSRTCRSWTS